MKIAVAGGTGFIGTHLIQYLQRTGAEVLVISRNASRAGSYYAGASLLNWLEIENNPDPLEDLDAFINLAGESINSGWWTEERKKRILSSRIKATKAVANIVERLSVKPRVVINGSAVGVYGFSDKRVFTEKSVIDADDFLADVCRQWEQEADRIPAERVIKLRTGLVLGADGGAFPQITLPYRFFTGGRIGSGTQWMSWIHVEDAVRLIAFCVGNETLNGAVNMTAPEPVTNDHCGRTIGRCMGRPHWAPVPSFFLKAAFGEMSELLLKGQKVLPQKALDAGFSFNYPTIDKAIGNLIPRLSRKK